MLKTNPCQVCEPGGRFTALEGGLKKGLTFQHQSGAAASGGGARSLAFLLEQDLAASGIFDQLMAVEGAVVGSDFG